MKGISHTLLSYLAAAVFLLAIWWGLALLLELPIVPTPDKVFVRLTDVFARDILEHAAYSLWRIAAGLGLAVCIGYPLGVIMGYFRQADRFLSPVVYLTYPIPKIALLPILMLLAGVGELSKILMIFLIIVSIVVVSNTIKLTVFNRASEISIMKYVGATNWFIRGPFLAEGIIIGIISAGISVGISALLYQKIIDVIGAQVFSVLSMPMVPVDFLTYNFAWIFLALGISIGACGSIISMRKFLDA